MFVVCVIWFYLFIYLLFIYLFIVVVFGLMLCIGYSNSTAEHNVGHSSVKEIVNI